MSAAIEVRIDTAPVERCAADVAAVGFFAEDRPLRGPAGRVDWRLCGLISEALTSGRLPDRAGKAVLLPAFGRLRAPRILLLALGTRQKFRQETAARVMRVAVECGLDFGARTLAVAPLGISLVRYPSYAELILAAAGEVVAARETQLDLRVLVAPVGARRVLRALQDAAARVSVAGVSLDVSGDHASADLDPRGAYRPSRPGAGSGAGRPSIAPTHRY